MDLSLKKELELLLLLPYEQGEITARMALDIIVNGKVASDIPSKFTEQFVVFE